MTGKERYEARRQQENQTEIARLKMQEANYDKHRIADEVTIRVLQALDAFLKGEASFEISDAMGATGANARRVKFWMPPAAK